VPGTLTVVCARPGEGKSTILSNIGSYVAYRLKKPVLYIDTEMGFDEWRPRIISMMSDVPERKVKHGGYTEKELYNINRATELIKKGKYFHEYMPGYSVDKLAAIYKKYKYVEDIGLAIFDYIKAPPGEKFGSKKEYQVLGDVTTALKDLAGELEIPFICANQISRQDDVADSDRIIRYADVLMFFKKRTNEEMGKVSPFEKEYGYYKLIIKKSRRGGTTPSEGIGYDFIKKILQINEANKQLIDYESKEDQEQEEIEYDGSDSDDQFDDEDQMESF
jgi:replicative DNA helicase